MSETTLVAVIAAVVMAPVIVLAFRPDSARETIAACESACARSGRSFARWSPEGCVCGDERDAATEDSRAAPP